MSIIFHFPCYALIWAAVPCCLYSVVYTYLTAQALSSLSLEEDALISK